LGRFIAPEAGGYRIQPRASTLGTARPGDALTRRCAVAFLENNTRLAGLEVL